MKRVISIRLKESTLQKVDQEKVLQDRNRSQMIEFILNQWFQLQEFKKLNHK